MSGEVDVELSLPRWRGITAPVTVLTDVALGALAFVLGARLGVSGAAEGEAARMALGVGLLATSVAAMLGAGAHGADPVTAPRAREAAWRAALHVTGVVGAATIATVAWFAATGLWRTALLWIAAAKLCVYTVAVARRPEFRLAALDYGSALAVLLGGAAYAGLSWHSRGTVWIIGGVAVSLVAGVIQERRIAPNRHFNHNDLYHVIQMVALYFLYRGGALVVDR